MKSLTIAIFQGPPEKLGQVDQNVNKIKEMMIQAKSRGADVVVFPELFTSGYTLSNDLMRQLAEDKSGDTFMQLSQQAKETGIAVLYGYPELVEKDKSKIYYNSAQFVDKDGTSLANYQKTHLWVDYKQHEAAFTQGDSGFNIFEFCGFKIGLLICFDVEFSEAVRILAIKGAKIILAPVASCNDYKADFDCIQNFLLPAHCYENCVHMAYVNYSCNSFNGGSRIYDNRGEILVSFGEKDEGILTATIQESSAQSYHLGNRRPELYGVLVSETT